MSFTSLVPRPFRFRLTNLGWYFERVCRLTHLMGGKREGLAQFALHGTIFVLPETIYSKYLHRYFC